MRSNLFFCSLTPAVIFISCASSKNTTDNQLSKKEKTEGYQLLFNGKSMDQWTGATDTYLPENGAITIHPEKGSGGNLYTKKEYSDFDFRFEFKLTPGASNGVGIRTPLQGDAAYVGMEIQILDNDAPEYKDLHPYQYHGSIYGVVPAKRGYLKPVGQLSPMQISPKPPKTEPWTVSSILV